MITLSNELIKRLHDDDSFQIFMEYVYNRVMELDSVNGISELSNERAGEEVKARGLALDKLKELFDPIWDFTEKVKPDEKETKVAENKFGL